MFKVRKDEEGNITGINFSGTNLWVPQVVDNRHYQQYLEWVAEGNVAEEWTPGGE